MALQIDQTWNNILTSVKTWARIKFTLGDPF